MLEIVKAIGKGFNMNFVIDNSNKEFYKNMIMYFMDDPKIEDKGLSLKKGIMVRGNVGTGKTIAMLVFQYNPQRHYNFTKPFRLISTRQIQQEFANNGFKELEKYSTKSFQTSSFAYGKDKPFARCFDDLGVENHNAKFYGQDCNVIAEILLDRYEMFVKYGMITHATTNLTPTELSKIYGDRVRSRMAEMFNDFVLEGSDRRQN